MTEVSEAKSKKSKIPPKFFAGHVGFREWLPLFLREPVYPRLAVLPEKVCA
jgi:hypothetical protein